VRFKAIAAPRGVDLSSWISEDAQWDDMQLFHSRKSWIECNEGGLFLAGVHASFVKLPSRMPLVTSHRRRYTTPPPKVKFRRIVREGENAEATLSISRLRQNPARR